MSHVSIIVPIYNCANFVSKTLDSLLAQTYQDIDIICINDGSTDCSEQIVKGYAARDKRVKLLNQVNAGPAKARNTGLNNAKGPYIMFCDADDWYEPNMCAKMVEAIEYSKADVVMCQTFFEFETDDYKEAFAQKRGINDSYFNPSRFLKDLNQSRFHVNCLLWNKIWRKDVIDRYHIRFPEGCHHEDDAFWYLYSFCANRIFYLREKLYHYFIRTGSIMDDYAHLKMKNRFDRIRISYFVFDFLKEYGLLQRYSNEICFVFYQQFKLCRPFLTDDEIITSLIEINKRLKSDLGPSYFLGYYRQVLFLSLKKRNLISVLAGLLWYGLCWCFVSSHRRPKYNQRLFKSIFYLSCLKGVK